MPSFQVVSDYTPSGDQPEAIEALAQGVELGLDEQTLLGVTGSGKTFTMAKVIEKVQRPTLVLAHNKTLAAQLCAEFREFFPNNAVEYFVSYYDYYQPEAYIPHTDTFIEKDSAINDEIERLRHSATSALFERRDVIVVASVSCIYGLGDPIDYANMVISLRTGQERTIESLLSKLTEIRYERNDVAFDRNRFRVRGDTVEIFPVYAKDHAIRVEFFGDEIDRISEINVVTGSPIRRLTNIPIWPATHYVTPKDKMDAAIQEIYKELEERVAELESQVAQMDEENRRAQTALDENERLRKLLELRDAHRDFTFESAAITGRTTTSWSSTLTLSKGTSSGIEKDMCVVTETGYLVGVVTETGTNWATVNTLIDPSTNMGATAVRTEESAILTSDLDTMAKGCCKLSYLSPSAALGEGDQVMTSGMGGVYPSGIIVGTVTETDVTASGMEAYAVVEPSVHLDELSQVFVIKAFDVVE